ncbi:MAG: CHAD domain-containing protein [Bacteroidota bacterium]|nr:CHAD domain-containing protein [Bacteroidota bacterium]
MKKLTKYLDNRAEQISAFLEMPADAYNYDTFHVLRVEIKKLKFLIDLIKFSDDQFKEKKILRIFAQIFKYAGQVRDIHVELDVLKKYAKSDLFKKYENKLLAKKQRGEKKFFLVTGQLDNVMLKETFKELLLFSKSVTEDEVGNYLKKQRDIIEQHFKKESLQTEELHELRKTLKKLTYAENVMDEKRSQKKILQESLSDILGKWHDNLLVMEHLETALNSKKTTQEEMRFLKNIYLNLVFQNDNYLKIICSKIDQIRISLMF